MLSVCAGHSLLCEYSQALMRRIAVGLVGLIEIRSTDCFGETRLVPHVPSSS